MLAAEIAFWVSVGLVAYVYAGYPTLVYVLARLTRRTPAPDPRASSARVTMLVSAYNEELVIAEKIINCLALDYPSDRLELVIVSDASDDRTDAIVGEFEQQGVRLLRMDQRSGKTMGLNTAVESVMGEILVFSDANAMYNRDSLKMLVRGFSAADVGAVVGESRYQESSNEADSSESLYWRYESAIKRAESRVGSVVGGDGAIYAIRKDLYRPMRADALSDFVNPCQIVAQGYRCVYEPRAVSVEMAAGSFEKEYRRKVRIVNRAWRAVMSMKSLMNPFRYGFFSVQLISHKLLRWLVPAFLVVALVANGFLAGKHPIYAILLVLQASFYVLALIGGFMHLRGPIASLLFVPYYFCLVNLASARGILDAYLGKTYTTWSTARNNG